MSIYRAGRQPARFEDRCQRELEHVCRCRGNKNTYIDKQGPFCVIIDAEYEKVEAFGDVGVNGYNVEAVWLEADCLPVKRCSIIEDGCYRYEVAETPVRLGDGWVKARLKKGCAIC